MARKRGPAQRASRCVPEQGQSADAATLVEQEPDLHDHPELGHLVVLDDRLELLGPDGLDVADRAGRALHGFTDRLLVPLRGLAGQFDELCYRHGCLPRVRPGYGRPRPAGGQSIFGPASYKAPLKTLCWFRYKVT